MIFAVGPSGPFLGGDGHADLGPGELGGRRGGRLRAAVDVTDPEPLPPEHPLWTAPGVFITPHVAASTPVSWRRVAAFVRSQAQAYLRGEPLRNVITDTY